PRQRRGGGGRSGAEEEGAPRVQAGQGAMDERPLGSAHHRTPGFRYPFLDGRGQLPDCARRRPGRRRGRRDRPGRAVLMTRVSVDLIDTLAPMVETRVREPARRLPHLRYADVRLEVTEGKGAGAENG